MGLAAAAEEERTTALGASHVVTVTPGIGRRPNLVSKNAWHRKALVRHPGLMDFVRVKPDDMTQVAAVAGIEEAARQVDDPDAFPPIAKMLAGQMRYGWDLEPPEHYLYIPEGASDPVGLLVLDMPTRDNLHLVWAQIFVHPDHRRYGHGSVIMNEALRMARESGRSTIWVGTAEDDQGARRFVEGFGFRYASHDARRRQVLAECRSDRGAAAVGTWPRLRRQTTVWSDCSPPSPDEVLTAAGRSHCGDQRRADGRAHL